MTHCIDCGREIQQALEKAVGEPRDRAWEIVWRDGGEWICPVTGNEHRPGPVITPHETTMRQDANGRPYLAYFTEGYGFCWSGDLQQPVEVCYGGMGEPVMDTFEPDFEGKVDPNPFGILRHFQYLCDRYLEEIE